MPPTEPVPRSECPKSFIDGSVGDAFCFCLSLQRQVTRYLGAAFAESTLYHFERKEKDVLSTTVQSLATIMAATQSLPSLRNEEPQMEQEDYEWQKSLQNGIVTERRSPCMSPEETVRQERAPKTKRQSTIAFICGWIVEHQLGEYIDKIEEQEC